MKESSKFIIAILLLLLLVPATDAATTTIKVVCVLNGSRLGSRRSIVEVMMRL